MKFALYCTMCLKMRLASKEHQFIGSKSVIGLLITIFAKSKGYTDRRNTQLAITYKNHEFKMVSGIRLPPVEAIQRSSWLNFEAFKFTIRELLTAFNF